MNLEDAYHHGPQEQEHESDGHKLDFSGQGHSPPEIPGSLGWNLPNVKLGAEGAKDNLYLTTS
jgi:hypothetical protein